jgi:hypothetical protein
VVKRVRRAVFLASLRGARSQTQYTGELVHCWTHWALMIVGLASVMQSDRAPSRREAGSSSVRGQHDHGHASGGRAWQDLRLQPDAAHHGHRVPAADGEYSSRSVNPMTLTDMQLAPLTLLTGRARLPMHRGCLIAQLKVKCLVRPFNRCSWTRHGSVRLGARWRSAMHTSGKSCPRSRAIAASSTACRYCLLECIRRVLRCHCGVLAGSECYLAPSMAPDAGLLVC